MVEVQSGSAPTAAKDNQKLPVAAEEPKLPKLSAAEFSQYNRMAEHMDYFVSSDDIRRLSPVILTVFHSTTTSVNLGT